jgi:iron complex transport system substrate-binding protein
VSRARAGRGERERHREGGPRRKSLSGVLIAAALLGLPGLSISGEIPRGRGRVLETRLPGPAPAAAQVIADDLGHPFPLPAAAPRRIVSMAPNITEILFALGLGGRVAGVTRFCDWPEAARTLPKIGGLVDPNVEIIRSLDPDLVIAFRGNPLRLVERVRKLGLPVFVLDIGRTLDDLAPLIERIGRITRSGERAAALAAGLRRRLEAVAAALRGAPARPKALVLLYGQGLWTCGGESYVNDLVERAGGVNVAAAMPKKWVLYKREAIIRDDPDVIFILARSAADFETGRERLAKTPGLAGVRAVKAGRIFALDENAASRFGPRLVDVLDRMAALVHPERFGGGP